VSVRGSQFLTRVARVKVKGTAIIRRPPEQSQRLIQRLGEIPTPKMPAKPSAASLPAKGKQPSGD
jgi:hypothetical protein